jgi:hypothetical protein
MPSSIEGSAALQPVAITGQGRAAGDDPLVEVWLHGRSPHTQRAYRADAERFRTHIRVYLYKCRDSTIERFAARSLGSCDGKPA